MSSWTQIDGFPAYEISMGGEVRRDGYTLALTPAGNGYWKVQLWRAGKAYNRLIHVLVAATFLGACPPSHEVNHKDGDKSHNDVGNLEYLTRPENMRHAYRTGLRRPTVAAAVAARRKPRRQIPCGCGCGKTIQTPDAKGRDRRFSVGHHLRSAAA